jgi:hypothetical protein
VYNGDGNFNGSTSPILVQTVNPASGAAVISDVVTNQNTRRREAPFVDVTFTNTGTGTAFNTKVVRVTFNTLSGRGSVSLNTRLTHELPASLGTLNPGNSITMRFFLKLPDTVKQFSMTEGGSFRDAAEKGRDFKTTQTITP